MNGPPAKYVRNAKATRLAILESALVAFAQSGYDGAGVREIAQGAGGTAILVNRYFGSKEKLFEEVVEAMFSETSTGLKQLAKEEDLGTLSVKLTKALIPLAGPESTAADGFLLMIRSAANDRAARILRRKIAEHFEEPLGDLLPGPRQAESCLLILSIIAGVRLLCQVIEVSALAKVDVSTLSRHIQFLIDVLVGVGDGRTTRNERLRRPATAGVTKRGLNKQI
ncbi:MAG TPA: TetR/AcrR family transcriptional regulator [Chthoniobacterales bacterium]|nr:TetR/AcrR family transcriptional regulator [Chthoniobacterales bacterium]